MKDIQDSHRRIYTELINNNKELEKEIKNLRSENETNKNKKSNTNELNQKLEEINQEKEKYKKLEDTLKQEKETQIIMYTFNKINGVCEKLKSAYIVLDDIQRNGMPDTPIGNE